ncbi:MAG: 5-formyltetrahydrofolate cyclo-ligase [Rhodanobacteraceae bacterium]
MISARVMSTDDRAALREVLRARRLALPAAARVAAAAGVAQQLAQLAPFLSARLIGGYWAIAGELPLACVLPAARARGQQYLLPVIGRARKLRFAPWQPGAAIVPNRHGIPEPVCAARNMVEPCELDVVLVPLVGFDRRGHRLGFGGGYYDRAFAFLRGRERPARPVLVGIGYAMQELSRIEDAPWDVRLDYVASENELIDCS